jgi:hypothetical protein
LVGPNSFSSSSHTSNQATTVRILYILYRSLP